MKVITQSRPFIVGIGLEGALMVLSPLPLIFLSTGLDSGAFQIWRLVTASLAIIACFLCALYLFRRPQLGKFLGGVAAVGSYATAFPYIASDPFVGLTGTVLLICAAFALIDFRIMTYSTKRSDHLGRCLERALGAVSTVPFIVLLGIVPGSSFSVWLLYAIGISSIIAQLLYLHWCFTAQLKLHLLIPLAALAGLGMAYRSGSLTEFSLVALVISLLNLLSLRNKRTITERREHWWEFLLNHPARLLMTTFLSLCILGALLLMIPIATETGALNFIDALFTSTSAGCVTGLVVLDTQKDFTFFGQLVILLLIQLGGLGIMTITAVGMHVMGRRLSLKQERLLTSLTDWDHKNLIASLATILKFTFVSEGIGTALLMVLFVSTGDTPVQALWRAGFTSIAAFCNAGFALQSNNLIPYQSNPMILYVVSILIIVGGVAPITCLAIPRRLIGKPIPIPARIALVTTVVLLLTGTVLTLVFEWHGILAGLSISDKIHNAWFQSVTLRTAGFNSVDLSGITGSTFMFMVAFMLIGGSPGGTAGGIKTTTLAILVLTFWATITNRRDVIIFHRRIPSATIHHAITIVVSGMIIWFLAILMLEVTQSISARDLIFEVSSALGTVGLTTGATALLDEIGKLVIIIVMFAGRIGPMTLFTLLSEDQPLSVSRCPDIKISLT